MKWVLIAVAVVVVLVVVVVVIGMMLPQGHVANAAKRLDAPPAEVWEAITSVDAYAEWRSDVKAVEVLSSAPGAQRWKESGTNGDITYQVTRWAPEQELVVTIADEKLPFGGSWTYELKPDVGGTSLSVTERGEVYNPVFRFISHFFMSKTATMERYLEDLSVRVARAKSRS